MSIETHWTTEVVRLTVFRFPGVDIANAGWWSDVAGGEPEDVVSKPRTGIYRAEGSFGNGQLVLNIDATRIDWLYAIRQSQEPGDDNLFPALGDYREQHDLFSGAIVPWLAACPPSIRVAYGTNLLEMVEDKSRGYRRLSEFLHSVKLDTENSSDFSYQINRPRPSQVIPELAINRVSKWSVMRRSIGQLTINPATGVARGMAAPPYIVDACRLELDVNTDASRINELPHGELPLLFDELQRLANEIASTGDVP